MTRTDTPTPSLAKITPEPHACPSPPARNGPCWPATYATAGCMTPSTNGPSAPSRSAPGPEPSTTNTAPPTTPTTKPSAPSATASSASSTAACATTAPTTNTPPGPTACQRRRYKLRTWDVYSCACSFSNPVSHRDLLTCDDASCLTRCHRAFVSNSCHFFRTPLSIPWRHIQSLRDADQPVRRVPSRDGAIPTAAHA